MNKWYVHKPKFVLENETNKILCDFEMQTNHQISARRPDLVIVNNIKKREPEVSKTLLSILAGLNDALDSLF